MKLLIAGSRGMTDYKAVDYCISKVLKDHTTGVKPELVITGGALGVDTLAERWASKRSIPTKTVLPDWDRHGKRAGPIRNAAMVRMMDVGDVVIAIWDGKSKGTKSTIDLAKEAGVMTYVLKQEWVIQ